MAIPKMPGVRPARLNREKPIPTDPKALEKYEQVMKAIALRKKGYQWREIAKALEIAPMTIYDRVQKYMRTHIREEVEDLREVELERLDDYEKMLVKQAQGGGRNAPRAIEVALKVHERRAALLGMDAPQEVNVNAGPTIVEYLRDTAQDDHRAAVDAIIGE